MSDNKDWIGVDLDGTLAYYEKWVSETDIGSPIKPMVVRVKKWLEEGKDVRIFTDRVGALDDSVAKKAVKNWCFNFIGKSLPVTNIKDMHMVELWDDRAVQVRKNQGAPIEHREVSKLNMRETLVLTQLADKCDEHFGATGKEASFILRRLLEEHK